MAVQPFLIGNKASYSIIAVMKRRRLKDAIDLNGMRFGKLLVCEKIYIDNRRGVFWNCKCDCGNDCIAYGGHLRAGDRRSCGCLHEVNIEKTGCRILFGITKRKCKEKNREFTLSLEDFSSLIKNKCFYCDTPPSQEIKRCKSKKTQIIYTGIDRIDSSKGYIRENCVPCCKRCNRSKSDLSIDEWKSHLLKIINHLGLK